MINTNMTESSNQNLQVLGQKKSKNGREMHGVYAKVDYPFDLNNFPEEEEEFKSNKLFSSFVVGENFRSKAIDR